MNCLKTHSFFTICITSLMLQASSLMATNIDWLGTTDDATLGSNWVGGTAPGSGDVARLTGDGQDPVISTPGALSYLGLTFLADSNYSFFAPASLTIGANGVVGSPGTSGQIIVALDSTLTVNGPSSSIDGTVNYSLNIGSNFLTLTSGQTGSSVTNLSMVAGTNVATISNSLTISDVNSISNNTLNLQAGTLTFGTANNNSIAGTITGNGGLRKRGTGTTTITDVTNNYLGGTNIQQGVIEIPSTAVLGNPTGTPTVTLGQGTLRWTAGDPTAAVAITTDGTGTTLNPSVIDTGAFPVFINTNGPAVGSISGTGVLEKQGSGALALFNSSSGFTGTIHVDDGALVGLVSPTSIPSVPIINDSIVSFQQEVPVTYSSNMSGTGSVGIANGTGVTYSNTNTYTGGTFLTENSTLTTQGHHVPQTGAVDIEGPATWFIPQIVNGTFGGTITGGGTVNKSGAAMLTLTGDSSAFTGSTTMSAGELHMASASALGGTFTMSNGVLSGFGTIGTLGDLASITNGFIRPGASVGTLSFVGDFSQTGGEYEVEISGFGLVPGVNNDLIDVGENATLSAPAYVRVVSLDGGFMINGRYTILTSDSLSGTYSPTVLTDLILTPELTYDAGNVYLDFRNAFIATGINQNSRNVAIQLTTITDPTPAEEELLTNIVSLSIQGMGEALNQLSGSLYSEVLLTTELATSQFVRRLYDPVRAFVTNYDPFCICCDDWETAFWVEAGGVFSSFNSSFEAPGVSNNGYQVSLGFQKTFDPSFLGGIAFSYEHTHSRFALGGSGNFDTFMAALYGVHRREECYLLADLVVGGNWNNVDRSFFVDTVEYFASGGPRGVQSLLYGEIGRNFRFVSFIITPFAAFEAGYYSIYSFTETGSSPITLQFEDRSYGAVNTRLGTHLVWEDFSNCVDLSIDLAWVYRCTSLSDYWSGSFVEFGEYFPILGSNLDPNSFEVLVNFEEDLSCGWSVFASGSWRQWSNANASSVLGGIGYSW